MEEEKGQKELFEFEKPKRSFPKHSNFLPKADFERNILITLSLEKIIFISIGLILAMVVVYALGVEVGRTRAASQIVQQVSVKKVAPVAQPPALRVPKTVAAAQDMARPYIIVAGAYSRKDNALSAMARLKQAGFGAYIGKSAPLFQVWVGAKTGSDALKELAKVRKLCKDAYLKTR